MAEWSDQYWTSSDGIRLHYRDYDGPRDRPPLLCLPGLTRNARDFEPLADLYAGRWRVLAVDLRGRGLSEFDPNPERYVPSTYVADLLKLLDQLGIADALFVGTSLGGLVTMLLALSDPERIAGALLNDIGPQIEAAGIERLRSYVGRDSRFASWDEAAAAVAVINGAAYPAYGPDEWRGMARRLCREQDGAIRFDYDMAIALPFAAAARGPAGDAWPLVDALAKIPTTILRGEHSDLLSPAVARTMAARLADVELVTVPGVGHAPMLDEPEAVPAIDRLLARVLAAADLAEEMARF